MRNRASVLLYVPLLTVLVTGCTEAPEPAKINPVDSGTKPTTDATTTKAPKKKKDPYSFTGPTGVAP
jgi:hypothetical protein